MAESILKKIVERGHYRFADSVPSWQEAVRVSTEPLIRTGCVEPDYWRRIVDCIEKYGPYMVYDHGAAMPHAQENAAGTLKTAVGFLRLREPVSFGVDEDGEIKTARLLFTLSDTDPAEHFANIQSLMTVFTNYPLLDALAECDTPEELLAAEAMYPPAEENQFLSE